MKKLYLMLLLLIGTGASLLAQQKFTINGHIRDKANGEGMIGATIYIPEISSGATTNVYGFYSITLPAGDYTLVFRSLGYVTLEQKISLNGNTKLEIELEEEKSTLEEVVVTGERVDANVKSMEMSVNKLEMKTIQRMPALLGEVDVIRSIQLLPGVSTVGEGASGFNVRGGGVDQNLILLDESPVYNSSHLFGFFSVFNPDAVKDVKLIKGGIPAQYGGRLSSLLDVRMKDGNSKELSGTGGVGTVSSRLSVEAPIIKDKSSFILAGRRSYADLFLKLSPDENLRENAAYFYDLSAKVNYKLNDRNTFYLSGYFGKDVFKFADLFKMSWGNYTSTIRWNHLFSERLFANFTGIYSNYDYLLGSNLSSQGFEWKSNIINWSPKVDLAYYLNTNNTLTFGASAIFYTFKPGDISVTSDSFFNAYQAPWQYGREYAAYVDNEQKIGTRLSLQYGLRVSAFDYQGPRTVYDYVGVTGQRKRPVNPRTFEKGESIAFYPNVEPRISANIATDNNSSIKASYNRMVQYIHLISNTTAASPLDIWQPSTNNIKPERADQWVLGYFRNFQDNRFETSVEGYYKTMSNQIDYINGAQLLLNDSLEGDLLYGKGRSYGLEFFAKKNTGALTGWISYTLSRSERQIEGINQGNWYRAKYDKTHNLSVVGIYELNERWSFSGNFTYSTGVVTTFPNARWEYEGITIPYNTNDVRNNFRVPAYHRLDLAATLQNKPRKNWDSNWVFSIYNVYARKNAYSIYFRQNADNPTNTEAVRLAILGIFVPAVTYNFNF
ncbi:TonB-dependent receptor [Cytophagales bacterium LB-30]|uniref:TonB-dependent receptor n=1 Tax=Shiella aurantiaca TaxID=3058365 RepID=A0ABT8F8L2_9BACT|nr:TonB-dependent receptor [Shiella aurantiaca]MDN4166714.1 TonB-dependent receptor [Shiella aurantiaca]